MKMLDFGTYVGMVDDETYTVLKTAWLNSDQPHDCKRDGHSFSHIMQAGSHDPVLVVCSYCDARWKAERV